MAGLIKLDPQAGILASPKDIKENPKNIEILELDAHQIANALADVDGGVIGTGLAMDAGLKIEDALFIDT